MPETIKNNETSDLEENPYSTLQNEPSFEEHMESRSEEDLGEFHFGPNPVEAHSDSDTINTDMLDSYSGRLKRDPALEFSHHIVGEGNRPEDFRLASEKVNSREDDTMFIEVNGYKMPFHPGRSPIDKAFEQDILRRDVRQTWQPGKPRDDGESGVYKDNEYSNSE